jgi:secreted trypsin-like serine protease
LKNSILVFLILCLGACGLQRRTQRNSGLQTIGIIGGSEVDATSPISSSVVAVLGFNGRSKYLCTGVLLTREKVLTAAHCGTDMQNGEILFSTDLESQNPRLRRSISEVSVQPAFGETMGRLENRPGKSPNSIKNWGDLAILSFKGGIPRNYKTVQIASENNLEDGEPVILAGYGLLDGNTSESAQKLNAVTVTVKKAKYSKSEFTINQDGTKGACHGDSGGPAFITEGRELILVGITSRGFDEECQKPTIYTKVAPFQDWINTTLLSE